MKKEQFLVTVASHFEAAHSIKTHSGLCEKLHGHRWRIEAYFSGKLEESGMVRDFLELEKEMQSRVIARLDHTNLNDIFPLATTELICRWIWDQLSEIGVVELRLWETPDYSIVYRRQ